MSISFNKKIKQISEWLRVDTHCRPAIFYIQVSASNNKKEFSDPVPDIFLPEDYIYRIDSGICPGMCRIDSEAFDSDDK